MKKLFLAIALLATVASCTKDNVTSQNNEAIGFGKPFVPNTVRSIDPSYGPNAVALTAFNVYGTVEGVNIFNGNTVSKGDSEYGTEAWSCTGTTQYWVAGANYIFDAVVGATAVNQDATTKLPTSLSYTASTQTDMLHNRVTTTGKPADNNGLVTFEFTHLLSKVKFTVENTTASTATNYQYTISDIVITNTYATGDYAVPAGTWSNTISGTQSVNAITVASASSEESATEYLLIPGANVGVSFKVNVQIKSGDEWKTLSTTPVTKSNVVTLAANTAYNFQISVGLDDEIKFTAKPLPDWTNANPNPSI